MFMVQDTPRSSPRLTRLPLSDPFDLIFLTTRSARGIGTFTLGDFPLFPTILPTCHSDSALDTVCAKGQTAVLACDGTIAGWKDEAAMIARARTVPCLGTPHS